MQRARASVKLEDVKRVVVIEDHADTAELMAELLGAAGHQVRVALTGSDGIAAARELRADVVFCDVGLPDIDGYAVARALRADEATRSARMIALTGFDGADDAERARAAGFDLHVVKPLDPSQLESLLR